MSGRGPRVGLCRGYTAYLAARAYETLGTVDAATTLPHDLSEGGGGVRGGER